jgi:hypothetical protein
MSGKAAKITFHRNSAPNSDRSVAGENELEADGTAGNHHSIGLCEAQQLADRPETGRWKTLRGKVETPLAEFLSGLAGD